MFPLSATNSSEWLETVETVLWYLPFLYLTFLKIFIICSPLKYVHIIILLTFDKTFSLV